MVLPLVAAALGLADAAAMGYSLITKGEPYGLDYYVTGHDVIGEMLDVIWPTGSGESSTSDNSWAINTDAVMVAAILTLSMMAAIVFLRILRRARLSHDAKRYRRRRR